MNLKAQKLPRVTDQEETEGRWGREKGSPWMVGQLQAAQHESDWGPWKRGGRGCDRKVIWRNKPTDPRSSVDPKCMKHEENSTVSHENEAAQTRHKGENLKTSWSRGTTSARRHTGREDSRFVPGDITDKVAVAWHRGRAGRWTRVLWNMVRQWFSRSWC